jgi:enoyl-CoA hydratase
MNRTEDDALILDALDPQIRVLRLNRPARLNAFTREMVTDFNRHLDALAEDRACRAVILTGTGRGFCSGQDVTAADSRNRHAPSTVAERMYCRNSSPVWAHGFARCRRW